MHEAHRHRPLAHRGGDPFGRAAADIPRGGHAGQTGLEQERTQGRTSEARAALARLARASSSRHVSAYHVAAIHVALGDISSGLDWLERAYEEQSP